MNEFALECKYKYNFKYCSTKSCQIYKKEDFVKQYLQLNSLFSDKKLPLAGTDSFQVW